MRLLRNYVKWFSKYKFYLIASIPLFFVYGTIHELMHGFALNNFGYEFKIVFSFPVFRTLPIGLEANPPSLFAAFIILMMPYLMSILLILIFFFFRKRNKFSLYLAIFPFLDTVANLIGIMPAILLAQQNDFLSAYNIGLGSLALLIVFMTLTSFMPVLNEHIKRLKTL